MLTSFQLPFKVIVGNHASSKLYEILRDLGYKSAVIITDDVVYDIVGSKIERKLSSDINIYFHIIKESTKDEFEKARTVIKELNPNTVIGLGGGKVIDAAKYASYFEKLSFISVPTALSHDGIASPSVSLKDEEGKPLSYYAKPPIAVVADLTLISKAPRRLTRSGFADAIGKRTSVRDALLAIKIKGEQINPYSLYLARLSYVIAAKNANEIADSSFKGLTSLFYSLLTGSMAMIVANSSRPCSGSEHLFSHALDMVCPNKRSLHGEQVGVGTIMMAYLHGINWRKIRKLLLKVGAPVNNESLGVDSRCIIKALTVAHRIRDRYTVLGNGLSEGAAVYLAKHTKVI